MHISLLKLSLLLLGALLIAYVVWDGVISQVAMPIIVLKDPE